MNRVLKGFAVGLLSLGVTAYGVEASKQIGFEKVWEEYYGGEDTDRAKGVMALEDGDVAVVGNCQSFGAKQNDICLTRVNKEGKTLWRVMLGGDNVEEASSLSRAKDGTILVVGTSRSLSKKRDNDIYVAKVSLEGKGLWQVSLGKEGHEFGRVIAGTDDGGAIVVGERESVTTAYKDLLLIKIDKDGYTMWEKSIGGEKEENVRGMTRTLDGHLVIVGAREVDRAGDSDFFALKIDQEGNMFWAKNYGGEYEDQLNGVTPTLDGGVVAVGYTRSYGSIQTDLSVMKFDTNGELLWHKIYGYKRYDYANSVTLTREGNVIVAGGTDSMGEGVHDVYVLALGSDGELYWSGLYGGRNTDIAYGVTRTSDGSIVVVGESDSNGESEGVGSSKDFYLLKLDKAKPIKKVAPITEIKK